MPDDVITSIEELVALYPPVHHIAAAMQIDHLDAHCRDYLAHCSFVVLGTSGPDGTGDVSPKGGPPGFVQVLDDHRLAIGDRPGNYRLDSLRNVLARPEVGLLCLIPGFGEALRINGRAIVVRTDAVLERCTIGGERPLTAIVVEVAEAYIHCSKAMYRSSLWKPDEWPDTSDMATVACMVEDHLKLAAIRSRR